VRPVAGVDGDQQRRHRLRHAGHLQAPAVDAAQAVDALDQRRAALLVGAPVAAEQDVLVDVAVEVAQQRGADGVQRAEHGDALGHHLLRLLRGRALRHAEHARRAPADGRRQRHRRVDEHLSGRQHVAQVVQRLGLTAKRHAEDHELVAGGGGLVGQPGDDGAGEEPARA
jgi:hypothetical protein